MSKFNSKEFEKEQIEKLKQEQLIRSILNRQDIEIAATIQATKESLHKTLAEIEKRKCEILQKKLNQQNIENEKQIEDKRKLIKSVEKEVRILNEQEKQLARQRKQNVDEILKELNIRNNNKVLKQYQEMQRKKLEKSENEKLRQRNIIQEKKRKNILAQLKLENNKQKQKIEQLEKKQMLQRNEKFTTKHNNKEVKTETNNSKVENKFTIVKEKILNFKLVKAINAYKNNMKYYYGENNVGSKFDVTIGEVKKNNSKKETRKNFAQALHSVINHKEAQQETQNRVAPRFEPRTH